MTRITATGPSTERRSMNILLGDRWESFIKEMVKSGHYGSASEVICEGLRLLEQREAKLDALRKTLNASIERGGSHTAEEVMEFIQARMVQPQKRERSS